MRTWRTAIYVRVSTGDQSIASQLPELKAWVKGKGKALWFQDAFTGTTMRRPAFDSLMDNVRTGHVNQVVVWRLDRLGRTAGGLIELFGELTDRKVNLVSIRDGLDFSTASGRLHANILASVAQWENEVRAERVRAGMQAARIKGKKIGGSKKGRRIKVSEEKERVVKGLLDAGGVCIAAIARVTGLSRPTIYAIQSEYLNSKK